MEGLLCWCYVTGKLLKRAKELLKKTFLIGLLYFGEQEDVRMFFFNLVLLMRFLSKLSLSLARKNTWEKGYSNFLIFQKPYFRLFSRSARLGSVGARVVCRTDVLQDLQGSLIDVQRKTLKQNQSWNIQLFSVHANVQPCLLQLHAGCPFSWQVISYYSKPPLQQ